MNAQHYAESGTHQIRLRSHSIHQDSAYSWARHNCDYAELCIIAKAWDGLAALVRETLGANPYGGVIYVFRSKRSDRVKLLFWDGTGLVLATKRLEQGSFRWPSLREGVMRLTPANSRLCWRG
jgi:transposase